MITTSTRAFAPAPATKLVAFVYSIWVWKGMAADDIQGRAEWAKLPHRPARPEQVRHPRGIGGRRRGGKQAGGDAVPHPRDVRREGRLRRRWRRRQRRQRARQQGR